MYEESRSSMPPSENNWWRHFFESPAAFELGLFPDEAQTDAEVEGLWRMLDLHPGMRVADICCGAGRHLVRLAARGLQMVGLDSSRLMIRLACDNATKWNVAAHLVRGDARWLPFRSECFDVVLNLFNSFGYLPSDEQNELVLREMARCLRPGGTLLIDTRNRQSQILFAPYRLEVTLPDGRPAVVTCHYCRATKRLDSIWRDPDNEQAVYYYASIRLYGLEELDQMMAEAGLERIALYGDYMGTCFEGFHRQLLYVAQKT